MLCGAAGVETALSSQECLGMWTFGHFLGVARTRRPGRGFAELGVSAGSRRVETQFLQTLKK